MMTKKNGKEKMMFLMIILICSLVFSFLAYDCFVAKPIRRERAYEQAKETFLEETRNKVNLCSLNQQDFLVSGIVEVKYRELLILASNETVYYEELDNYNLRFYLVKEDTIFWAQIIFIPPMP